MRTGRYQLIERLGSGGMGEVYLAHDPHLDRRVAIKLLPPHLAADSVARERLRREALAAAALDHPFICKIFEIGEEADTVFLVMEYIRGETLLARMRAGRLPLAEALRIADEIAEAIEEAHANGIIHRDLKPANIMLTSQGRVKVMDFGLATKAPAIADGETITLPGAPLTAAGAIVGTPDYMSPEQLTASALDRRSDLFSFGIVLCEMLAGRHPFRRRSALETMAAILRDPPALSVSGSAEFSPGWMLFVRRLLSKSPDERYPTMAEARADMARLAVQGPADAFPGGQSAATAPMHLVGRDAERAELLRLLDAALEGRGSLAMIGGEPGIGKTHLTRALLSEAARRGCFTVVGHCYEMEGAPPYVPFIEMLEYSARIAPRASFRYSVGDAAPEVAKLMPELRRMFPDIPPPIELPPEQQRRFLFNAYREFVERSARVTPIVAIFEDLHWADEPTLLLLTHLAQSVASVPVLMIGTYRDVELEATRPFARVIEGLIRERLATRLSLRRLASSGVQSLLETLSGKTPPASLVNAIFNETEGNPFFVEEVFQYLAERGKLFDERGEWLTALRSDELQVPQSVRLVIGRRLERLREETRRVLTTAAVIGRSFHLPLLEDLENERPDEALEALEEAERAHLVRAEREGREMRYRFVHELVRQTLAQSLSLPRRQRLHARVASSIERIYGANVESQASALAYHFYQAGSSADLNKTILYATMAARMASAGAAHEEALTHIDHAISLTAADPHPSLADLHAARAVALRSLARFPEAIEAYERAFALFAQAGNIPRAAETGFHLGYVHLWNADVGQAFAVIDRAVDLVGAQPSPLSHRLLYFKAANLSLAGDIDGGFEALAEAQRIEAALPETRGDGFALMCEARVRWAAAQFAKSDRCARLAIARFRAGGDLWAEAELFEPIPAALWLGRPAEAEEFLTDLRARAERVGHQNIVWVCKTFACMLHMAHGDLAAAERSERDAFEFGRSFAGGWHFLSTINLAAIAHLRGDFEQAIQWFRTGLAIEPPSYMSGLLSGGLFRTLATLGDPGAEEALEGARRFLPVAERQLSVGSCGCLAFVIEGLTLLGRLDEAAAFESAAERVVANGAFCVHDQHLARTAAGMASAAARNWERAEEHHRIAVEQADTAPYRVAQPIARSWYALMLRARDRPGDREHARTLLREASEFYKTMGMNWHARRIADDRAANV